MGELELLKEENAKLKAQLASALFERDALQNVVNEASALVNKMVDYKPPPPLVLAPENKKVMDVTAMRKEARLAFQRGMSFIEVVKHLRAEYTDNLGDAIEAANHVRYDY